MKRNSEVQIAAIYCRLSKEDDDKLKAGDESGSIQNQKLLLMEYAVNKGFKIYKIYVDDDYSGFSDRPQFKQMLIDAEAGLFNIVLCKHQSRFTRDMQLVEEYIHGRFAEWGIRFISLTDNVDTAVKGGKKSRQINGLINEWYCEDLSENVKSVIKAKREKGQFVGAFVSYGYKKDPEDKHKLIVDEEAAAVVKEIFSRYLSGIGAHGIAQELTLKGILTPAQYKKEKGSKFSSPNQTAFSLNYGAWSVNTVRRILRNETYIGNMVQGREKSISYKTKKLVQVPKSQWAVVPDTHEPIIKKEDFYVVQKLIDSRRTTHNQNLFTDREKSRLLAGKIRCLDCGSLLQRGGQSKDRQKIYYRCSLAQKTKNNGCTPHNVNSTAIEKLLEKKIHSMVKMALQNNYEEIYEGIRHELNQNQVNKEAVKKRLNVIETKLEEGEKSIGMMYSDRLKGLITEEEFIVFKNHFMVNKEKLLMQKDNLKKEIDSLSEKYTLEETLSDFIRGNKKIPQLSHEIINNFVDCIEVGESDKSVGVQEVIIYWKF